jgi:hypothetical protein
MKSRWLVTNVGCIGLIGLTLVGCKNDPFADTVENAAAIETSRSVTFQSVGGTFSITGVLLSPLRNRIPTQLEVTSSNPASLRLDSVVYFPELRETRAYATPIRLDTTGVTLTFSGGGITEAVVVNGLPAGLRIVVGDELGSGDSANVTVQGLDRAGTSFGNVPFTITASSDTNIIAIRAGTRVVAKGVGTATITVAGPAGGTTTKSITVVPGTFNGTVVQSAFSGGQILTVTAGAVPFDADTEVKLGTQSLILLSRTTSTIRVILPFGQAGGTLPVFVERVGPSQLALRANVNITAVGSADTLEPNNTAGTATALTPGTDVIASVSGSDVDDYYTLTVTTAGTFTLEINWSNTADIDAAILGPTTYVFNSCNADALRCAAATTARPERGTTVSIAPGSYRVYVNNYTPSGVSTYLLRVTAN